MCELFLAIHTLLFGRKPEERIGGQVQIFRYIFVPTLLSLAAVKAATIYSTAPGAAAGGVTVNAEADFTFGRGALTLVLRNNLVNQVTDGQNLSAIFFTLKNEGAVVDLSSVAAVTNSGIQRTVTGIGANQFSDTAYGGANLWLLRFGDGVFTDSFHLSSTGLPQAKNTILGRPDGSNAYSDINSSIVGSVHNPFFAVSATWVFNITDATPGTSVSDVIFSFGSKPGSNVPARLYTDFTGSPTEVPEPLSFLLAASGLFFLYFLRRHQSAWSQYAPRANRTAATVLAKMYRSSHGDQLRI
jgi:hypothetical protein